MPRKTRRAGPERPADEDTSMRPRLDAAENGRTQDLWNRWWQETSMRPRLDAAENRVRLIRGW